MRIKYIIPFPFDDEGIANRAAQIPKELLGPDTDVECIPVRNSATLLWSASESGFSFDSDPLASGFATIGHERNGFFFH